MLRAPLDLKCLAWRRRRCVGIFSALSAVGLHGVGHIALCLVPRQNEQSYLGSALLLAAERAEKPCGLASCLKKNKFEPLKLIQDCKRLNLKP